nr:MAG TPA: hypothetical protein [Caudoviricetes sp.]
MSKLKDKMSGNILLIIGFIIIIILAYAISWIATCGIIKLITLCFGWTFRWSVSTGIWLALILERTVFKPSSK